MINITKKENYTINIVRKEDYMINILNEMAEFKKQYRSKYINNELMKNLEYREKKQEPDMMRGEFQRDRDRIIHSRAFRRLSGKTQVFNSNKGDHYRTRLTHSLEVSQIGRSIGKVFGLNEDLIEAIALGHDLGHTPFGHVIERTLHDILKNGEIEDLKIKINGGFKHNFQSLHLVDNIEMGYNSERGLNLTLAVRDGILKHTGSEITSHRMGNKEKVQYEEVNLGLNSINLMDYKHSITLEGQIVSLADEIAQSTHDLEDGVRSGIIKIKDLIDDLEKKLEEIKIDMKNQRFCINNYSEESPLIINKLISDLIDFFITDAIVNSKKNILNHIEGNKKIFNNKGLVTELFIDNSKEVKKLREYISGYIHKNVVSSQEVSQSDSKAKYLIKQIFKAYYEDPRQLPDYTLKRYFSRNGNTLDRTIILDEKLSLQQDPRFIRIICDHIAGMTDSFAMEEYNNLYGVNYIF